MSKLRVQNTNIVNNIKPSLKVPAKSNTTTSTTSSTTKKAVLSIEINQDMATSIDNQCLISQLQGVKSKRPALESLSTNVNYSQATSLGGNNNNTNNASTASNCTNNPQKATGLRKSESILANIHKKPAASLTRKASSKENLTTAQQKIKSNVKLGANKQAINSKLSKSEQSNLNQHKKEQKPILLDEITKKLSGSTGSISMEVKIEETATNTTTTTTSTSTATTSCAAAEMDVFTEEMPEYTAETLPGWNDIDVDDKDEFSCSDYVNQIFKYYRDRENKFVIEDYLKQQKQINRHMRLLLVDWMVEVQQQLEFNHEVLYLSVKLIDLYLNKRLIEKEKLQLLGGAAMFIACKFEERMPPIIDDFIYVSDNAYDRNELIKMEMEILKTVKFDIGIPLSYTFLRRYSKCIKADMKFLTLARYILELSLQDYTFAPERDSLKACAALYLAIKMVVTNENEQKVSSPNFDESNLAVSSSNFTYQEWNETLTHYTGSFLKDFAHLLPSMNSLIKTAPQSKYKTIFKKYSHPVFYEVTQIPALDEQDLNMLLKNAYNEF